MSISRTGRSDVFAWLEHVKARPGMYVGSGPDQLRELESTLGGYYTSLGVHGIVEPVPNMSHHFRTWLYYKTGWSTSAGWAPAVRAHSHRDEQLAVFFRLVDEYKTLRAQLRFSAARRGRAPGQPTRIDIIRYAPTRLHFLRIWQGHRASDDWFLMDRNGSHQTSLAFAKRALVEKFPAFGPKLLNRNG